MKRTQQIPRGAAINPHIMNVIRAIKAAGVTPSQGMLDGIFADRTETRRALQAWNRAIRSGVYYDRPKDGTQIAVVWSACDLAKEQGEQHVTVKTIAAVTKRLKLTPKTLATQVSRWRVMNGQGPTTTA